MHDRLAAVDQILNANSLLKRFRDTFMELFFSMTFGEVILFFRCPAIRGNSNCWESKTTIRYYD